MFFNPGGRCAGNRRPVGSVLASLFVLLLSVTASYAQRTSAVVSSDTIGNEEITGPRLLSARRHLQRPTRCAAAESELSGSDWGD